ncbi:VTT domain-containing protein [Pelagicoccus sp. SDUM812005]|uniref:VTT domain-containing protein n=1 Tax=Pelagicoccus sp. SDUM812005 TaxID=3041257 RepID=UPI00280DF1BA|nr:VTT domain-containing protein [Pelagicoccus sp. SDUM812005]MDQ8180197.1 VTT domain-containing protein [Pelagicoccus sp. SDUM812005]
MSRLGTRTLLFALYAAALLASHLWQGRQDDDGERDLSYGAEARGKDLYVLFGRIGGSGEELRALEMDLASKPEAVVWTPFAEGAFPLEALAEGVSAAGARRVVVSGIGYGSIDALNLASALPGGADSLVLVSPAISTRFELLGDERLNRALKTFQLAWFWLLDKGVPHFGLGQALPYNYETAKRVYDADQAAASQLYYDYEGDLSVLYPKDEGFAASGARDAYEAVRAEVEVKRFEGGASLGAFLANESRAVAVRRGGKEELPTFDAFPGAQLGAGWGGFLLAVSTLASEDFACIGGGLLAASGAIALTPAVLGCLLGIFIGDLGIYFIGRIFGATAMELPVLRHLVSAKALGRSSEWFEKRGVALVVLTRFFPGSRVPTYFAAGVVKVSWIRFSLALLLAAAIWTPILVLLSYFLGERFLAFFESLGAGGWLGIVALILCFGLGVRLISKLASWKGRRLLYGKWKRMSCWEFWPIWAVYAPVLAQILWLAIRYRSVTLPFSVNPCMPASGLVYESKIQILSHLEKSGVPIARFEAIRLELPLAAKLERLNGFRARLGLDYPVVLKPDVGQRGQGVTLVRSEAQARSFFEQQQEDTIVQEYVEGSEYGVFYQRFASRQFGELTSITDKRMTWVEGDGISTLETLILQDKRAVCMAPFFLKEYAAELESVPEAGKRFMLASIGTHSRGAVFLDGASLITPELVAEVDRFSRGIEGFHFGRYDLRVPSEAALKRGEGIKVIELNGITSEPTHMYDPCHGPLFGWASLMRQWRAIFALAKENRLAGHEPVSKREVLKLAWGHFRGLPSRDLA